MSVPYLIFTCAGSVFALPIDAVVEVLRMVAPSARLPRAPRYCLGAIDYHGRLVPLIDLSARLGLGPVRKVDELLDSRIMLVNSRVGDLDEILGYVVDDVSELSDRPLSPLTTNSQRYGGLVVGALRWQEKKTALALDLRAGALLPVLAGRQMLQALAAAESRREIEPELGPEPMPPLLDEPKDFHEP